MTRESPWRILARRPAKQFVPLAPPVVASIDIAEWSGLSPLQRDQLRSASPALARVQDQPLTWSKVPGAFETSPIANPETLDVVRALAKRFGVDLEERPVI